MALDFRLRIIRNDLILLFPGFLHQIREDFIHPHFVDMVDIQLRQTAPDIVQEHVAASDDAELGGLVEIFVVVQKVRDPVEGHRCFSAAGHTLDDDIFAGQIPDDGILLLLDGGDDIPQHGVLILRKIFHQQVVIGGDIIIVVAVQRAVGNVVGPFLVEIDFHIAGSGNGVMSVSQTVFIVHIGHRSPPVHDNHIGLIFRNAVFPDIAAFRGLVGQIVVDNPPEIRLIQRRSVFAEGILHMLQNILACDQLTVGIPLPLADSLKQRCNLFSRGLFSGLIQPDIFLNHGKTAFQMQEFFLIILIHHDHSFLFRPSQTLSLHYSRRTIERKSEKVGFLHFFSGMISEKLFRKYVSAEEDSGQRTI